MTTELMHPPTVKEITAQLERMLAARRFCTATNQADVLKFLVESALLDKKVPEETIARALFPKYRKDESTDVRVTISNLRRSLQRYYREEGRADLILISLPSPARDRTLKLPPGEAYKPGFSFNPGHEANRQFRLGMMYATRGHAADLLSAAEHLHKATELYPEHLEAVIAVGHVFCEMALLYQESDGLRPIPLNTAELCAKRAIQLAPQHCGTHLLAGRYFFLTRQMRYAENAYSLALHADERMTEDNFHYWMFLAAVHEIDAAVFLARRYAAEHLDDANAIARYGSLLYRLDRFVESEQVLDRALVLDRNCFYAQYHLALIYMDTDRIAMAREMSERFRVTLDPVMFTRMRAGLGDDGKST